jgi:hypothetical protein
MDGSGKPNDGIVGSFMSPLMGHTDLGSDELFAQTIGPIKKCPLLFFVELDGAE